jgi:hypothetical protein
MKNYKINFQYHQILSAIKIDENNKYYQISKCSRSLLIFSGRMFESAQIIQKEGG